MLKAPRQHRWIWVPWSFHEETGFCGRQLPKSSALGFILIKNLSLYHHLYPKVPLCYAEPSSLGAKTHQTLAKQDQLPSPSASLLKQRFFIPSAHDFPEGPTRGGSALTACPPTRLQTSCSWGPRRDVLGGRLHRRTATTTTAPREPRTSASTRLFVYQFLANEPLSSKKKVIQTDSKDESFRKLWREQWGNVWTWGLQPS